MSIAAVSLDLNAPAPLFRAQLRSWTAGVVGEVVDHSIEESRKQREEAAAQRAKREADEQRAAAREAQELRRREEAEARDARALAELYSSRKTAIAA